MKYAALTLSGRQPTVDDQAVRGWFSLVETAKTRNAVVVPQTIPSRAESLSIEGGTVCAGVFAAALIDYGTIQLRVGAVGRERIVGSARTIGFEVVGRLSSKDEDGSLKTLAAGRLCLPVLSDVGAYMAAAEAQRLAVGVADFMVDDMVGAIGSTTVRSSLEDVIGAYPFTVSDELAVGLAWLFE